MIGFLQPLALVGLVLGAIPPLLHLLGRRRPPTVVFPAIQYLTATEREHSRRLKLRNLVLMILRVAVIVLLVLAAARPVIRVGGGSSHPPTALAVVLDNSLSSSAVVAGQRTLDLLKERARSVIEQATEDDRLWLVLADATPQRVSRGEALALVDSITAWPVRLDLRVAGWVAARVVGETGLPHGEVVVLSDLQASALSLGEAADVPVLVLEPPPPPENLGVDSAIADPLIWSPNGAVVASLGGIGESPRAVQLLLGDRAVARAVGAAGDQIVLSGRGLGGGWARAAVELDPDELRADDRWWLSVRLGNPAAVHVESGAGRFVEEAVRVLVQAGLAEDGGRVTVTDRLFAGVTVLLPQSDRALVVATNRALASRGVGTRFGDLLEGEWALEGEVGPIAGIPVYRRYRLRGNGQVLATVAGEPWLVRDRDVIVVASRLEDTWTALPVSAAFVPFLYFLLNRAAAEQTWIVRSTPGAV
ncbi:MAG: BatA domain-containing protein, partial [Gemmatimonadota bacterium]